MRTVIAGGHGQIALRLERLLAASGDSVVGLIRDPEQADDLRAVGAEPAVLDLESATAAQVARVLRGADAAVFAAGSGPGSSVERKQSVDRDAAVLLAEAAASAGVPRFLLVSSTGAAADAVSSDPVFEAYLRAKGAAEDAIRARDDLDWTILRPGVLTNDPGTGLVELAPAPRPAADRGSVPRDDVSAVLAALLDAPSTIGRTLELVSGSVPVAEAVGGMPQG